MNADDIANRLPFKITGGWLANSFYNKKLKPKKEYKKSKLKSQLEDYFNNLIKNIENHVAKKENSNEDW